jgi:predicted PhzF superfamily epimerase YddE/YHI9
VALLLGLAACAGDPGSGSITDDSRTRPDAGDTGATDTFVPPTSQTRLEFVSSQNVYMPFAGTAELTVRYVDFNDQPVADATINFAIDEAFAADTRLRTQTTRTDAEGIAFEVRAFFPGNNGLAEDPVTGSLNAALAQWLIGAGLAPPRYVAAQGTAMARAGRVYIEQDAEGIWVGGNSVTCIDGTVLL